MIEVTKGDPETTELFELAELCFKDYEYVTEKPEEANAIINHFTNPKRGAIIEATTLPSGFQSRLSVHCKKLRMEGKQVNLENVTGAIVSYLVSREMEKFSCILAMWEILSRELKDPNDHGFSLGFKRIIMGNFYEGKMERYIQNTVNSVIERVLGEGEGACYCNTGQLFRLENVDSVVSPLIREFLDCGFYEECIDFVERNPVILSHESRVEIFEQIIRLLLVNRYQDAKQCNLRLGFLMYAKFLKHLTRPYFLSSHVKIFDNFTKKLLRNGEYARDLHSSNYMDNFNYTFTIPHFYDEFVINIPVEGEEKYRPFELLPTSLREAIKIGTPEAISDSLDGMSSAAYVRALCLCSQGSFFYFKYNVPYSNFRIKDFQEK